MFFLQGILSDILKCLGDNKKQMRECTLNTLDSWLAAVHLDKMVIPFLSFQFHLSAPCYVYDQNPILFFVQIPYITTALTDAKLGAEGRRDLFDWLSKQLTGLPAFPDAIHLLKPAAASMTVYLAQNKFCYCKT